MKANDTKSYRFTIPCLDGQRRFVFCRAMNRVDHQSNGTGTAVFATDSKDNAFVSHGEEAAQNNLAYFTEHSHGLAVAIA